jgi:hypothetical protein
VIAASQSSDAAHFGERNDMTADSRKKRFLLADRHYMV